MKMRRLLRSPGDISGPSSESTVPKAQCSAPEAGGTFLVPKAQCSAPSRWEISRNPSVQNLSPLYLTGEGTLMPTTAQILETLDLLLLVLDWHCASMQLSWLAVHQQPSPPCVRLHLEKQNRLLSLKSRA